MEWHLCILSAGRGKIVVFFFKASYCFHKEKKTVLLLKIFGIILLHSIKKKAEVQSKYKTLLHVINNDCLLEG